MSNKKNDDKIDVVQPHFASSNLFYMSRFWTGLYLAVNWLVYMSAAYNGGDTSIGRFLNFKLVDGFVRSGYCLSIFHELIFLPYLFLRACFESENSPRYYGGAGFKGIPYYMCVAYGKRILHLTFTIL